MIYTCDGYVKKKKNKHTAQLLPFIPIEQCKLLVSQSDSLYHWQWVLLYFFQHPHRIQHCLQCVLHLELACRRQASFLGQGEDPHTATTEYCLDLKHYLKEKRWHGKYQLIRKLSKEELLPVKRPAMQFNLPKQKFSTAIDIGCLIKTNFLLHGLSHINSSEMSAHYIMSGVFDLFCPCILNM